jgi:hypothetical protein
MAKKVVIEVEAKTGKFDQAIEASEDAVKDLGKTGQTVVGGLDKITGGLASRFLEARAGIGQLVKGLNLTKVAIAATGIGLLITAIGSLVAYFTQTKRGSELLAQGMAGLKAAFAVITDLAVKLGEGIVNAFQNPKQALEDFSNLMKQYVQDKIDAVIKTFGLLGSAAKKLFEGDFSGALEDAGAAAETFIMDASGIGDIVKIGQAVAEEFGEVAEAISEAAQAAADLEQAQQRLQDRQRETLVLTAKERAGIKELNLIAENTTRTIDERIQAAEEAGAKERALFERRRAEAEEALRIRREQNALSESTAEDLQAEAELEAEVYNLQAESLELQTTLQNKLNALKAEGVRQEEEERQRLEEQKEEDRLAAEAEAEAAEQARQERIEREKAAAEAIVEAERKAAEERRKIEEALQQSRKDLVANTLDAFKSLNELFAKDDERSAKRAFNISKALGIADASVKTAQAVADALAKDGVPGVPGSRFAAAAAAGLAGAAQIATIARSQFNGGAQGASVPQPVGGGPTAPPAPNFEAGAFRSYVLASDVSTGLQAQQKVQEQSLLL